jgi:predicted phosphate transport protein (TIGR00153 family)
LLGGKLEQEAFKILKNNAKAVHEVVKKFEELVTAYFSEEDLEKAEALGREVSSLETRADKGRRDFLALMMKGAFLPAFRGDLAWLAERLDRVADTAEGAMRSILLRKQLLEALKRAEKRSRKVREWRSRFLRMAKLTTTTVEILRESVEALEKDIGTALRKAKDVDSLEHQIDLLEEATVSDLYELEKLFDPLSVVQFADILRRIGNISDRAEDMSDSIAILAMTLTA